MKKGALQFLTFGILFLLAAPFSFDFFTPVKHSQHTSSFLPEFIVIALITMVLLIVTVAYWVLVRKIGKINDYLFTAHLLLTIPILLLLNIPALFSNNHPPPAYLTNLFYVFFITGQILFFFYYVKIISKDKNR